MNLKIFACGDIYNKNSKEDFVDDNLKNIIKKCDVSICNFEGPVKSDGMKPIKKAGPHIFQDKTSIKTLKDSGFNLVSLANNHIFDYGQDALNETIKELEKNNIDYIGGGKNYKDTYRTKIINKHGIKIGILSAAENEFGCMYEEMNRGGYAWIFSEIIEDNIRSLKKEVDFVILLAHAGVENIEIPIKEWRNKYKRFCDLGVDVIIGHHPHVSQGFEHYNKSIIFYSLGNFYFDYGELNDKSDDSYSVILDISKEKIDFEIIYHKKINQKTKLTEEQDVNFNIEYLNNLLRDEYEKRNNDVCLKLFNSYYYDYYKTALGLFPKNTKHINKIKHFIKKIFFNKQILDNNNLLLLHNIRIDSHRFVVQRALSLISEEKEYNK